MLLVVFLLVREDKYVIEVDNDCNIQEWSKEVVDECLPGGRGICESKRHDKIFVESKPGSEGGLPFLPFLDSYPVIGFLDIELCEDLRSLDAVERFRYKWEWVSVFDCDVVESSVVDAKAEFVCSLLLDEEYWVSSWRSRRSDVSFLQILFQVFS